MWSGIVAGVLDMDYAPQPMLVNSTRCYLNVSQDGKDDLVSARAVAGAVAGAVGVVVAAAAAAGVEVAAAIGVVVAVAAAVQLQ